jgi:hypothetical protein
VCAHFCTGIVPPFREYSWICSCPGQSCENLCVSPDGCPIEIDEIAEAYLMGRLAAKETRLFEEHYFGCVACADRLRSIEKYVIAMKTAVARLRYGNGLEG